MKVLLSTVTAGRLFGESGTLVMLLLSPRSIRARGGVAGPYPNLLICFSDSGWSRSTLGLSVCLCDGFPSFLGLSRILLF